ncbi:MAG TPA: hypothetical protein VKU00_23510 [Chthonomonadaceae bacterium]|nr:hypothetical protein [Chthonomonadaceae bacterium]
MRIPAIIIAALYIFLCTFGPLTHTHLAQMGDDSATLSISQGHMNALPAATLQRGASHSTRCPYCEWEANCLSAALVRYQIPHTSLESAYSFPLVCYLDSRYLLHLSSRGPPVT